MKTASLRALMVCAGAGLLAMVLEPVPSRAQSQSGGVAGSREIVSRQATVPVHRAVRGPLLKTPPDASTQRPINVIIHPQLLTPVDPSVRPEDIRPTSPETIVRMAPAAGLSGPSLAPRAAGDFSLFRNTSLANAPVVNTVSLTGSIPIEPSAAADGRVVFYTTNNYDAISGDGGQTFTYINPADNFPADGVNDAAPGGFGGDQVVYYERTRGMMFWLVQYFPDNNNNTHRLAVASPSNVLANSWYYYDFTPADYGFQNPPGASGVWFDFPDVSVSDNFLYLTTNVFPRVLPNPANQCAGTCPTTSCPAACMNTCTNTCLGIGAAIARLPLAQLAQAQSLQFNYSTDTHSGYRCTHGAHATMYWAAHNSSTSLRIYRWDESSNTIAFDNVGHAAYTPASTTAFSAVAVGDGSDFAAQADDRILGAWVAQNVIGFMWGAAQGGGFAYPHVQVLRFKENDRTLLSQGQVQNPSIAFLYPSVHPNDRGHLGGTIASGGGSFYPTALAWIADDVNGGVITPLEQVTVASGTAGPSYVGPGRNRWGDYFATRVAVPYGNTWSGTGYVELAAAGANHEPHYVWFGRERDRPPPVRTIFVDWRNGSGIEDGSAAHPFNTVGEGTFTSSPGDTITIHAGNYAETIQSSTATTIINEGGVVTIAP